MCFFFRTGIPATRRPRKSSAAPSWLSGTSASKSGRQPARFRRPFKKPMRTWSPKPPCSSRASSSAIGTFSTDSKKVSSRNAFVAVSRNTSPGVWPIRQRCGPNTARAFSCRSQTSRMAPAASEITKAFCGSPSSSSALAPPPSLWRLKSSAMETANASIKATTSCCAPAPRCNISTVARRTS